MGEKIKLNLEENGFKGTYYPCQRDKNAGVVVISGDSDEDFLSRAFAKYFVSAGLSTLSLSLNQEGTSDTGVSLWKLEYAKRAVDHLFNDGIKKVAVCGISMQAVIALAASSADPRISLVIAFTPCDYVPWGFAHGKLLDEKNAEWPTGESLLCLEGKALPFQKAPLPKLEYWEKFCQDKRQYKEMHSKGIFELSERKESVSEETFIKVENSHAQLFLVGAEDDSMWDSSRYIRRMEERLKEKGYSYPVDVFTPVVGTHLLLPQSLVAGAVPVFSSLIYRLFASGRKFPAECKKARCELDKKMDALLKKFKEV